MVDADERHVERPGDRLRVREADEERPDEARARGDGHGADVGERRAQPRRGPRRAPGRSSAGGPARRPRERSRRSRRGARPGSRRPGRRSGGGPSRSATPVSSQDDSTARRSPPLTSAARARAGPAISARSDAMRAVICGARQRLRRHDEGVLVVVAVVARPDPDGPEAVLLVEPARGQVREADLERRLPGAPRDRPGRGAAIEEALADPPAAPGRGDGERRDVGLVDHEPDARRRRSPRGRRGRRGSGRGGSSRARCGRRTTARAS